ncbi:lipase 3-like isoform X3 [Thrips palmi]|uniref:Lipase 3-like isoform X3 n=1 Tax=Thrips palmi TaxID=161013 RepID=A0A6P9AG11_THRPL|nr:lipase 3-like isoform X3 [Thrips palmi]
MELRTRGASGEGEFSSGSDSEACGHCRRGGFGALSGEASPCCIITKFDAMPSPVALLLLLLLAAPSPSADAFLFSGDVHDNLNATVAHVFRVVRRCIGAFGPDDHLHPGHGPGHAEPPATPLNPPYREPPPSSVELCASRGFQCERHEVRTADGYTLALVHVLGRAGAARVAGQTPVLVQHGMLMSSDAYLLRKDDDNLPLILSGAGFDVWVGNYRGNAVSPHEHVTLSPDSYQFWNFSWHEMGLHDLPALVDYVLERSGQDDLHYIGHSMGSTGMMVLLSSRPEYNRKIRLATFLAPVAYVSRLRSRLFTQLASVAGRIKDFLVSHRIWNVLPRSAAIHRLADTLCLFPGADKLVCNPLLFEIAGHSPEHVLPNYASLIGAYLPAGTTIRIMEHYYEVARTGKFRPLGYGMGDPNPGAEYNIAAITAPVALYYSANDYFVYPPDVEQLANDLPNVFHKYLVPDSTFNHFDFILGVDARQLLFKEVLGVMLQREAALNSLHSQTHSFNPNDLLVHYLLSQKKSLYF